MPPSGAKSTSVGVHLYHTQRNSGEHTHTDTHTQTHTHTHTHTQPSHPLTSCKIYHTYCNSPQERVGLFCGKTVISLLPFSLVLCLYLIPSCFTLRPCALSHSFDASLSSLFPLLSLSLSLSAQSMKPGVVPLLRHLCC